MRIARLTDPALLRALYRFRHCIYADELGWLSSEEGVLIDDYDQTAYNYAAYNDAGEVVGSIRVVPDCPLGLPVERSFPLNGFRDGKRLVEFSRLAIAREYRGSRLSLRLMKAAYDRAVLEAATHVVIDAYLDHAQVVLYESLGFERLGEPFHDDGYRCSLPVLVLTQPVSHMAEAWPTARPMLHRFFTSRDLEIDHGR